MDTHTHTHTHTHVHTHTCTHTHYTRSLTLGSVSPHHQRDPPCLHQGEAGAVEAPPGQCHVDPHSHSPPALRPCSEPLANYRGLLLNPSPSRACQPHGSLGPRAEIDTSLQTVIDDSHGWSF